MEVKHLLEAVWQTAEKAAAAIMDIYEQPDAAWGVEVKADNSPVTLADKAANAIIVAGLAEISDYPIVAEESPIPPFAERQGKPIWLVDPVDGTRQFMARNGEFVTNIALIDAEGRPVLAVMYLPAEQAGYYAICGGGAFYRKGKMDTRLQNELPNADPLRVVVSSSHRHQSLADWQKQYPDARIQPVGAALKLTMLAHNQADLYPRHSPTMEWDLAAGQLIVEEAGGVLWEIGTQTPLKYNKEDLLNPGIEAWRVRPR